LLTKFLSVIYVNEIIYSTFGQNLSNNNMDKKSFGEKIRELRDTNNLSLKDVSEILEIDISTLSKIEKNKRSANKDMIVKLSKIFKINEKDLMISFLSDKVAYNLINEEYAEETLIVAEEKVKYLKRIQDNENK